MNQQMAIKLKPEDGERSPERTALASAIDAHRRLKAELQGLNDAISKGQEARWGLRSKLEKLQEEARAAKVAQYIPAGVADVVERLEACRRLPYGQTEHDETVRQAREFMAPPVPSEEEKQLQAKIAEWFKIEQAQEHKLDDLRLKITWAELAVKARASEVIAAALATRDHLRGYEIARAQLEAKAGGLRYVQSKLSSDSIVGREIGISLRSMSLHPRPDITAAFDALLLDPDAVVPQL